MKRIAIVALVLASLAADRSERWEYGRIADSLRAGHGFSAITRDGVVPTAYAEPLYPLLLAALENVPLLLTLLQVGCLVAAGAMLARVVNAPGVAAFVALWPPALVLAARFHPQSLRAALLAGLVLAAYRRNAVWMGVALGLCVWVRAVYIVPGIALLLLSLIRSGDSASPFGSSERSESRPRRLDSPPSAARSTRTGEDELYVRRFGRRSGRLLDANGFLVTIGIAVLIASPWWIRNVVAFKTFVPFTTNGGLTLALGNHPGASGEILNFEYAGAGEMVRVSGAAYDSQNEAQRDRAYARAALGWIAANPWEAARLWARKAGFLLWMRPSAGENYPIVLRWAYAAFALVTAPLLALGIARADPRTRALLLTPALLLLATFACFAVNNRYRFEADVLLAPFVAIGAASVARLRVRLSAPALALLLAVPAALVGAWTGDPALRASLLIDRDRPEPVDAVFVLSGDVDFHRTIHGAQVFRETGARWFVVSGAGAGGDSGELMAGAARDAGVPESAIVVETKATSTRENVMFSRGELGRRGVRSVAVVTSPYHSRRAALAARRAWPGIRIVSLPVPDDHPLSCREHGLPECRKMAASEREKLLGYLARGWL